MLTDTVPPVKACAHMTELVGTAHAVRITEPPAGIVKLDAELADPTSGPRDTYPLDGPLLVITRSRLYPVVGVV
jgi:hypothetical protein